MVLQVAANDNAYYRAAEVKSNTSLSHDTLSRTIVTIHNATVQQPLTKVSPNLNPNIVMCQAKAGFVSKHNVVTFRCPTCTL
ncbi:hypothetical protein TNCV_3018141 [Trichonephila clavipes]|nr:hypothetical protein TNCV_3018141 [Trichonephila clavipes]